MRAFLLPAIFRKAVASLKIIHTFALALHIHYILSICGTRFGNPYNRNTNKLLRLWRCSERCNCILPQGEYVAQPKVGVFYL